MVMRVDAGVKRTEVEKPLISEESGGIDQAGHETFIEAGFGR